MKRLLSLFLTICMAIGHCLASAWWGYWTTPRGLNDVAAFNAGTNDCAIRVVATSSPALIGSQLSGIRFYISDKSKVTAAKVWVAGRTMSEHSVDIDIEPTALRDIVHDNAPTEVFLDSPVELLPANNRYASAYVGFSITVSESGACHMIAAGTDYAPTNSNYYGNKTVEGTCGALALQLQVEGPNIPAHAVKAINATPTAFIISDSGASIPLALTQAGTEPVKDLDYTITLTPKMDGLKPTSIQRHCQLAETTDELDAPFTLQAAMAMPATAAVYDATITITHVNGQPNESTTPTATATATALTQATQHRVVMEEATAVWCDNCTRGIIGIKRLHEMFPDNFIAIAMHGSDDPMLLPEYRSSAVGRKMTSLPICYFDRTTLADPYAGERPLYDLHFYADEVVRKHLSQPSVADIELQARWADDSHTVVDIDATTTFRYSTPEAHYAIALVLTADDLHHESNEWRQNNGYSYTRSKSEGLDQDMQEFVDLPYRLVDYHFNHVAVAVAGINEGLAASIQPLIVADQPQQFHYSWNIAGNPILNSTTTPQQPSAMHVVALLLNNDAATADQPVPIVNAAIATLDTANGIEETADVRSRSEDEVWYDLSGRRVAKNNGSSTPTKGLYITRGRKIVFNSNGH